MSTIKDVAKYAGVSIATVSRVINNQQNVKPATAEKVNQAIEACHFIPNALARNLKIERGQTIGFLVSDISNTYFTVMAKTLQTELQKLGYNMMICSTDDNSELEMVYLRQFLSSQVSGIILNTTGKNSEFIEKISQDTPVVLIERQIAAARFKGDFIGADNYAGVYELTEYLINKNHRKIGIINGNLEVSTGTERYQGFLGAMKKYELLNNEEYPYIYNTNSFMEEGGYQAVEHLLSLPEPPSAIIVTNNAMSVGALKYIKKHDIQVPEDLSVMCYGNIENSELFFVEPAYTTLNPHSVGLKAFHYMTSRLETPELQNRETIFESKLYSGKSVSSYTAK